MTVIVPYISLTMCYACFSAFMLPMRYSKGLISSNKMCGMIQCIKNDVRDQFWGDSPNVNSTARSLPTK